MTQDVVAIVTDSSASLPPDVAERAGIIVVPISTVLDGGTYLDGGLPARQFYARLASATGRPLTTSPAPRQFVEAFLAAQNARASAVLCLVMSSRLSATFRAAESAVALAADGLRIPVRVVDTHGLAMTHGFAVMAAAEALRSGASIEEAEAAALRVGSGAELVGALDSMRYLAKGGRVPRIVHWTASALQIKPVLAWSDGEVRTVARARTMDGALERIAGYACARTNGGRVRAAAMHTDAPSIAAQLVDLVRKRIPVDDVLIAEFTIAMGVHTGPGFVGLAFYEE